MIKIPRAVELKINVIRVSDVLNIYIQDYSETNKTAEYKDDCSTQVMTLYTQINLKHSSCAEYRPILHH